MTAADLIRALADHGVTVTVEADLCLNGPHQPPADLVDELQGRKTEVIAYLLGPGPGLGGVDPADVALFRSRNGPRGSWLIGLGLLARRLAHATDPEVKARLERLMRITPRTVDDFAAFDRRVDEVLNALEAEGRLPPV